MMMKMMMMVMIIITIIIFKACFTPNCKSKSYKQYKKCFSKYYITLYIILTTSYFYFNTKYNKKGNVLCNDALNIYFYCWLYGVGKYDKILFDRGQSYVCTSSKYILNRRKQDIGIENQIMLH